MKIALINENSQAAKNEIICNTLKSVVEPMGHEVLNFGMYSAEDETQLTYVMNGLLSAILLESGAVDFVVTGCGTGQGAMLALNSFPVVTLQTQQMLTSLLRLIPATPLLCLLHKALVGVLN